MNTMNECIINLYAGTAIMVAAAEYGRLHKVFSEEETNGEEIPAYFAAATRLRGLLEDLDCKPEIVKEYIGLLDSDVRMMRAIIRGVQKTDGEA